MKSYNNLYEKMLSDDNIRLAIMEAARNKRKNNRRHRRLRYMAKHADEYIEIVRGWILNFEPPKHKPIEINDGISAKKRTIIVPTVREVLVHHAAINVLKPIFMKGMYEHSYASIPNRGTHKAVKTIKKWIYKNDSSTKYCLKIDIKKFFDSVDQDILIAKLNKLIRDKHYMEIIEKIIRTVDKGIPLGFTTSQWFANFLLTELDHKIKEEWGAVHSVRFMDDMVIFGSNKKKLHELRIKIQNYLEQDLHLCLKNNWQVFFMDSTRSRKKKGHFLDFLGFKFYRTHVGFRRKLALKMQRKAKHIYKKGRANIHDARQMVTYSGYRKYVDCYNWFQTHINPYVDLRKLRKQISRYDKQQARQRRSNNVVQN